MNRADGVLDIFIVEATEYIDRLDALLAASRDGLANVDAWVRYARALRGSATMFRQPGIARLAGALDAVVHGLRAGTVTWDQHLHALATATIDDLRILLRNARAWGEDEDRRVVARAAELEQLIPVEAARHAPPAAHRSSLTYLASQAGELADALERVVAAPSDHGLVTSALQRVRALRGVAELREMSVLPEIGERVERAAQAIEIGGGAASEESLALFSAAARLLWRASGDLAAGRQPGSDEHDRQRFDAAVAALPTGAGGEHIVPISELFYDGDEPGVVTAAPRPPTTAFERFRLEVGSQAEHLRRLVAEARTAGDPDAVDRTARALRGALRALASAAESFGAHQVADLLRAWGERVLALDHTALSALDGAALLLADPSVRGDELTAQLERLTPDRLEGARAERAALAPQPPVAAPAAPPGRDRRRGMTPTGRELHAFLEDGLAGLSALERQPLGEPRSLGDEDIVPVETLLYRGQAAIARAVELRDTLRQRPMPPPTEVLDELYDMLDLAATE